VQHNKVFVYMIVSMFLIGLFLQVRFQLHVHWPFVLTGHTVRVACHVQSGVPCLKIVNYDPWGELSAETGLPLSQRIQEKSGNFIFSQGKKKDFYTNQGKSGMF